MKQKKNNNLILILALVLTIFVALGLLYYLLIYSKDQTAEVDVVDFEIFKSVDGELIESLGELRACGNWPILTISPNSDRGNPFYRKNLEIVPLTVTVTPECLQVKRK